MVGNGAVWVWKTHYNSYNWFFFLIYSQLVRRVIIPCVAVKGHNCVDIVAPPKKTLVCFRRLCAFPIGNASYGKSIGDLLFGLALRNLVIYHCFSGTRTARATTTNTQYENGLHFRHQNHLHLRTIVSNGVVYQFHEGHFFTFSSLGLIPRDDRCELQHPWCGQGDGWSNASIWAKQGVWERSSGAPTWWLTPVIKQAKQLQSTYSWGHSPLNNWDELPSSLEFPERGPLNQQIQSFLTCPS